MFSYTPWIQVLVADDAGPTSSRLPPQKELLPAQAGRSSLNPGHLLFLLTRCAGYPHTAERICLQMKCSSLPTYIAAVYTVLIECGADVIKLAVPPICRHNCTGSSRGLSRTATSPPSGLQKQSALLQYVPSLCRNRAPGRTK